ncbi:MULTISPECIES: hypothetical protein [unclassified Bacillus (in: firmicutes)]|uniref:hypothetical protein n=1 Tax=unclassified Bacillus (in: firmicutes) TaxID=185979 RepID=UPI001BE8B318|nr:MULTISPECIES: hypothetical protein [unclassified Bacillus (in: firmicutes)]MBT2638492.1 hypothetical protein [Bacillus sp. ISL-39]MBT2662142.1 hypothetical protein [Bacillus sp. ISL-45]
MKKNRYLLYLLLCGMMLYIGMPELNFQMGGKEALFAGSWLFLALLVFAGNLAAFLYTPKKRSRAGSRKMESSLKRKSRVYTG